ncbi:hypothetical protein MmiHf6_17250 [Methanimicrococcus hongohii]|uniref:Lipoprotein n=1 Tax=Methanimicrococcus hongohii TaxID=3028295 RepID=A0AA96ZTD3_9EURY|nr:hypothetical protein [Methanimicrococcus sp. Hf6]WNY24394.1 hypothetical protein MmiHf6_17250 [Methanimicrococcus sp. Hf6]
MKKSLFILIILLTAALVGVSGCLGGGDDADSNTTNNTTEPPVSEPDNSSNESGQSNATIITTFNASVVTVNPLPAGFTHLATRSVNANTEGIGVLEAYIGYRNMLTYDNANVYLAAYRCTSKTADECIQDMISSHASKYGSDSNVSTVTINGHEATLLEATTVDTPQQGRYILVWSNWSGDQYDDSFLIVVNGQVNYSVIKELAEASNL